MTEERHSMTCQYIHCHKKFRVSVHRRKFCCEACATKDSDLRVKLKAHVKASRKGEK